ncbi:MAG TPA: ABC transporter permease [Candidatus Polarisedimenticolaceae bacterium]|nr:ABC transporter permease [Candidatus Polarisedimenticolaceae bacterium]
MGTLVQDLRYALRRLAKNPGFALVAVLTLALGIGANAAIFSAARALLRPRLAVPAPERLVGLYRKVPQDAAYNRFSYPNYRDVRERSRVFDGLAAYYFTTLNLSGGGGTERAWGKIVSANYFAVLGVRPALGRGFLPEEDGPAGAHPVAVISHGLWQRRFGADPQVVGRELRLNGQPLTIVGVTPADFRGTEVGMVPDVWVPMAVAAQALSGQDWLAARGLGWLRVIGRLRSGVDVGQARAELETLGSALRREYPVDNEAFGIAVVSDFGIHPQARGQVRKFVLLLLGVTGLVLLVACANLANLLLARASARGREIGVRLALGARPRRVVRQLLTESILLGTLGGVAALLIAPWLIAGATALEPALGLPSRVELSLDRPVLGWTLLLAVVTGTLFGLAPALYGARVDVMGILRGDATGRAGRGARSRSLLVVAQVAASLVLLVTAGLFLRSLQAAQRIDPGFRADHLLALSFDLGLQGYGPERGVGFERELVERVGSLPGVGVCSLASLIPLSSDTDTTVFVDGYTPPSGLEGTVINFDVVGRDYFSTMDIALVRGRDFAAGGAGGPAVIVNESAARRFWPNADALGQRLRFGKNGPPHEVIGLARDSQYVALGEAPRPYVYLPLEQNYASSVTLLVRTTGEPAGLLPAVRAELAALDPDLPVPLATTMESYLAEQLAGPRLAAAGIGAFAALALLLAAVGVYGVTAYAVGQRTREIGIRLALGAARRDIVRLVLRQGAWLVLGGSALGAVGALAVTRLFSGFLYGIRPTDPLTFAAVIAVLALAALAAVLVPARRASRVDPMSVLRYE